VEQALHDLVGRLFGAAVDLDEHLAGGEVRIADHEQGVALEGGRAYQLDFGAVAIDVDRLGLRVVDGGAGRIALREGARLHDVEAFREVGGGEGQRVVRGVDLVHVVESARNAAAAGVEEVGDGQLDAFAPLEHDVVHRDAGGHLRDEDVEGGGVRGDAGQILGGRGGMGAARNGPGDRADRSAALLDGDFDAVGALRGIDDPALAAVAEAGRAGDADRDLAAADRGRVAVVAGEVLQDGAVGEGAGEGLGDVVAGIVQGQDHDAVAGVEAVGVRVLVAFEGEEVAVAFPALDFGTASEVLVDPDQVGNGAVAAFAEHVAVEAGDHPGLVLVGIGGIVGRAAVVFPGDVVAGVVDHRHADVAEDVGVGENGLAGVEGFVVAPDVEQAGGGPEIGAVCAETGQIAAEGAVGRLLHLVVEEAHRIAGALAVPVFDFAPGREDFGEDERVRAVAVVGKQVGRIAAEIVAAALGVVPLGLVQETAAAPAEELVGRVLAGVETQAIVVHGVAEPGDPAVEHLGGVFVGVGVGIAVVLAHVAQVGAAVHEIEALAVGVGLLAREALGVAVERMVFGADVDEIGEIGPHRGAVAFVVVPPVHARRALEVERVGVAFLPAHVEVGRRHAGIFAEVGPVAVVVHHDVGDDLDAEAVGVVHHGPQRAARAVARGQGAALGDVAEIEPIIEIVADVRPLGARAHGPLGRRRNPETVVARFGHLRQLLVHLVPVALEPLEQHFRLDGAGKGEQEKNRQGTGERRGRFHGHTPWNSWLDSSGFLRTEPYTVGNRLAKCGRE